MNFVFTFDVLAPKLHLLSHFNVKSHDQSMNISTFQRPGEVIQAYQGISEQEILLRSSLDCIMGADFSSQDTMCFFF